MAEIEAIGGCDTIIIGAGMGGLVAGNALAQQGYSVLIVDKQKIPGGCTTNFRRRDFRFDASTHLLNGCGPGGVIYEQLRKIDAHHLVEFIELDTLMLWRDLTNGRDVRLPVALAEYVDTLMRQIRGAVPVARVSFNRRRHTIVIDAPDTPLVSRTIADLLRRYGQDQSTVLEVTLAHA